MHQHCLLDFEIFCIFVSWNCVSIADNWQDLVLLQVSLLLKWHRVSARNEAISVVLRKLRIRSTTIDHLNCFVSWGEIKNLTNWTFYLTKLNFFFSTTIVATASFYKNLNLKNITEIFDENYFFSSVYHLGYIYFLAMFIIGKVLLSMQKRSSSSSNDPTKSSKQLDDKSITEKTTKNE